MAEAAEFDPATPWEELTDDQRQVVLYGSKQQVYVLQEPLRPRRAYHTTFEGVVPYKTAATPRPSPTACASGSKSYMREVPCPTCKGTGCGRAWP